MCLKAVIVCEYEKILVIIKMSADGPEADSFSHILIILKVSYNEIQSSAIWYAKGVHSILTGDSLPCSFDPDVTEQFSSFLHFLS